VKIFFDRFSRLVRVDKKTIIERLPYIGLDIEEINSDSIRVEYSPNRPDFSTDYGIARAMNGILGLKLGLPAYKAKAGSIKVTVDRRLRRIRPFIACLVARNLELDAEGIRQLISMQEDLHNGLARKRQKAAIGLHNLDAVLPPVRYFAAQDTFSFVPLGETTKMTVNEILERTDQGRTYARVLGGAKAFPILQDSAGMVLSFPPIINGSQTKVDTGTKNLFVDVTSTVDEVGEGILSIMAATLADAGARLESVLVKYSYRSVRTPNLSPSRIRLDIGLVRDVLGLNLSRPMISSCLSRSRLKLVGNQVLIPRYRIDLLHPVDIAEEVALGYGIDRLDPVYAPSTEAGQLNSFVTKLDRLATIASASGLMETAGYELIDEISLFANFDRAPTDKIEVENPKSRDHSILRDSLIPSLMSVLSRNGKEDYPQRIFEIGRVFKRDAQSVGESWHFCAFTAHSAATFSEAKMYLQGILRVGIGVEARTEQSGHWAFVPGRSAGVMANGKTVGHIGEVKPSALASFGVSVPVSGFEVDVDALLHTRERANKRELRSQEETAFVARHVKRPPAKAAMP
jgi:phenylalanyl-tRNA synthetase beta chain